MARHRVRRRPGQGARRRDVILIRRLRQIAEEVQRAVGRVRVSRRTRYATTRYVLID